MSLRADSDYVDRSPAQSAAMREAYAGLHAAEAWLLAAHAEQDWEAHREGVRAVEEWHHEIARIALEGRGR